MNHPDPHSPFVLNAVELGRRPGSMSHVQRRIPAPADFGVDLVRVPPGSEFDLDARMESVVEGVILTGMVRATVESECGRCLRPITQHLAVEICELYAYPDSTTDHTADADEVGRLQDEMIDSEPVIRDAVLLSLPTTPLCVQDCPGLCAGCGEHWADLPSDHSHEYIDPRWTALRELLETPADGRGTGSAQAGSRMSESVRAPDLTEQEN